MNYDMFHITVGNTWIPVHFYLPVSFSGHWDPVHRSTVQRLVDSPEDQFPLWAAAARSPAETQTTVYTFHVFSQTLL